MTTQGVDSKRRKGDHPTAARRLGHLEGKARPGLFEGLADGEGAGVQVNVLPAEPEDFATPHARGDGDQDGDVNRKRLSGFLFARPLNRVQQPRRIGLIEDVHFSVLRPWWINCVTGVSGEQLQAHGLAKCLAEDAVKMLCGLGGKALGSVLVLLSADAAVFLRFGVIALDVDRRQLGQPVGAEGGDQVFSDNLRVALERFGADVVAGLVDKPAL